MQRYVSFVHKHRKQLLIILVIMNILALIGVFRIRINSKFDVFIPDQSQYIDTLKEMNQVFGTSDQIIFLLEADSNQLTTDLVQEFRAFQQFLEDKSTVEHVKGPAPQKVALGTRVLDIEDITSQNVSQLEDYYDSIGSLSPLVKHEGKIYGNFTILPGEEFGHKDINAIEKYLKDHKIQYYASGDLFMQQKILDYVLLILIFLPPTAILLILTVFNIQMGSLKATILSIVPAGIAALWTMGIVGWIGQQVSIITVLAPIFTIVIGSADGLHFVSHVQEERSEGSERLTSIVETLKMVGIPMLITTVTSMAGFLSLLVMNTNSIRDLAVFASLGIFLAGVVTWYVLPLILTGDIVLKKPKKHNITFTNWIKKLWGLPSIVIVALLLIISFIGFSQVKTEFNQLMIYRDYTQVYRNFEKIMDVNQGSIPLFLFVKTGTDPLEPKYAKKLLALEDELANSPYVGKVMSVYDFYSTVYAQFTRQSTPTYPAQLMQVNMIHSMISQMSSDPTSQMIDRQEHATKIMVFPVNLENQTLDEIYKMVTTFNQNQQDMKVEITGVQYLMRDLNQSMIDNQTKSLILAFGIIFVLLYLSLQQFKPSLISLLPIACTVIFLYGFLGLSGISLNVFTTTIFSITIGVGIDYAIHFTSVWRSFRKKGLNSEEAVNKAYDYTSRPILANAFGLSIGLSALLFSPLRIHVYVSTLMWVSMISGVFLSLSFLPTILRKVH